MTIDYKALAERINEVIRKQEAVAQGPEWQSWLADLRTVVTTLNGMANAEPIYFVMSGDSWVEVSKEVQARHGTKWQRTLYTRPAPQPQPEKCGCRSCLTPAERLCTFVVCPQCGNKRCPRADDHRNACTDSNDPGQPQPEHQPASEQADGWPTGLLSRVKAAAERVQNNHAPRRIPADPTDVDLVLAEVQAMLEGRRPPFWVAGPTEAQPMSEDYIRGYDTGFIVGAEKGRSEPTETQIMAGLKVDAGLFMRSVSDYDRIRRILRAALAAKEPK